MDFCHCLHPNVRKIDKVDSCAACGMYFDAKQWKRDPRVKTKAFREAIILNEADEITNSIMRHGARKS